MYTIGVPSRFIIIIYPLLQYVLIYTNFKLGYYMSFLWLIRATSLLVILPREPTSVPHCLVSTLFTIS